jgi:DNA-nicking Smr family endonuclease
VSKPPVKARGLGGLAGLREALQSVRRNAERAQERERLARLHDKRERELFASSVGPVTPLRRPARPAPARPQPAPLARQRLRDEAKVLRESISDDFDVESLLDTDDNLSYRREGVGPEVVRKLRRGVWAIQAQVDLHGLRRDAARERLGAFLRESTQAGLRCVRVIHGKGNGSPGRTGVLKIKVNGWLVQRIEVIAFAQARAAEGGLGAVVVLLAPTLRQEVSR